MTLTRWTLALSVLLIVSATPVTAETPPPQVTDECGDATTHAELNGERATVEESQGHIDVRSGTIAGVYGADGSFDGFAGTIQVCGAVSALEGGYALSWSYGDRCYGDLGWSLSGRHDPHGEPGVQSHGQVTAGARPYVRETCYHQPASPLESGTETVYDVELPEKAVVFDGDTLTVTVSVGDLPSEAAQRVAPGTEWASIGAIAMDQGPSLWAFYRDTEGNSGDVYVRTDFARSDNGYVVGQDAPTG